MEQETIVGNSTEEVVGDWRVTAAGGKSQT
jgi:hypothetical protein